MIDFTSDSSWLLEEPQPNKLYEFYLTSAYYEGESVPSDTISAILVDQAENSNNALIHIAPNPAGEFVLIQSPELISSVDLVTLSGRTLLSIFPDRQLGVRILLEGIHSGIYLIKIKTGENFIVRKLVVN